MKVFDIEQPSCSSPLQLPPPPPLSSLSSIANNHQEDTDTYTPQTTAVRERLSHWQHYHCLPINKNRSAQSRPRC